jgi:hypothetical protein
MQVAFVETLASTKATCIIFCLYDFYIIFYSRFVGNFCLDCVGDRRITGTLIKAAMN